jgi:hypothetical protein
MSPRTRSHTATPGQWLAWAERRMIGADALVERMRGEARAARDLASTMRCRSCEVAITVPLDGDRLAFHRAYLIHELGCPDA